MSLPEPKTACSKLDFGDLKLTMREFKGYSFEVEVQNLLSNLGYAFEANPVSEHAWKQENIRRRADVTLANGVKIECKNIDGKVFLSWFKRDWLPKGSCVFVFKGDLKLSPAIIEQYHPILVHYSLLPIYLRYELPLFRGVTRLFEPISTKNVEGKENPTKTLELKSSEEKMPTKNTQLSISEKCLPDESINVEASSKRVPIPSSSLQAKTWKLEPVDGIAHVEISESFSISITSWKGEP
jgi:hypothetical protein